MTDPRQLTVAALIARCEEDPALAGCTYEGRAPEGATPQKYAALFLQRTVAYERLSIATPIAFDWVLTVHEVGVDATQAGLVAAALIRQLAGFRIVLDGWKQTACRLISSEPIDFDDKVQPPVAFGVDQFTWRSDAA